MRIGFNDHEMAYGRIWTGRDALIAGVRREARHDQR